MDSGLFVALCILLSSLTFAESIKCYKCTYANGTENDGRVSDGDCSPDNFNFKQKTQVCTDACLYKREKFTNESVIETRGCDTRVNITDRFGNSTKLKICFVHNATEEELEIRNIEIVETCYCGYDYCNTSSHFTASWFSVICLLLSLAFVTAKLHFILSCHS